MDSVIEKLKLEGKTKDFTWYKEKFDAGLLYINGERFKNNTFEYFRLAIKCVKEIYDDNWDIDVEIRESKVDVVGIVIHFPDITIKNSTNKRHNIKDLFILIPFSIGNNGALRINRIQGGRTTFTYAEYCSHYYHSHLSTNRPDTQRVAPYYTEFCTGAGNINVFNMGINADGFSEELFTQYLLAIVTLVNWESLEGTPYKRMETITERDNSNRYYYSAIYATRFLSYFLGKLRTLDEKDIKLNLDIYTESNGYKIRDNEAFEDFLMQFPLSDSQKRDFICFITPTGEAYKYTTSLNINYDIPDFTINNKSTYVYNGKHYRTNIITKQIAEEEKENIKFSLHPEIKNFLKKELEYELNKTTIRQSTISRYQDQIDHARESITSN